MTGTIKAQPSKTVFDIIDAEGRKRIVQAIKIAVAAVDFLDADIEKGGAEYQSEIEKMLGKRIVELEDSCAYLRKRV